MAYNAIGRLFRCQTPTVRQSVGSFTQTRSWSTRTIPTLAPTSSPELDQTLKRFRDDLFIPFSLSADQRLLIYRPSHAHKLIDNPITVTIGKNDELYRLRPIDRSTLPSRKDVAKVLDLMYETRNWSNLVHFLTGIRKAGMRITPGRWEWLIRKTGETNSLSYLFECAKQSSKTGFTLEKIPIVRRLFREIHLFAQRSDFKGPSISKALRIAKEFSSLMEAPEHIVYDLKEDPKRRLFVIGTLLEVSAAHALNELGGKDETGEVRTYARRLLASWQHENFSNENNAWVAVDFMLQEAVPIYHGMKLALQIDAVASDKSLAPGLKTHVNELGMLIANLKRMAPPELQEEPTIGLLQAQLLHRD